MVWRLFATQLERADTPEADRPTHGAPLLYSVSLHQSNPVEPQTFQAFPEAAQPRPASIRRVIFTKKCRLANLVVVQQFRSVYW